jgi:hypothetical protein
MLAGRIVFRVKRARSSRALSNMQIGDRFGLEHGALALFSTADRAYLAVLGLRYSSLVVSRSS